MVSHSVSSMSNLSFKLFILILYCAHATLSLSLVFYPIYLRRPISPSKVCVLFVSSISSCSLSTLCDLCSFMHSFNFLFSFWTIFMSRFTFITSSSVLFLSSRMTSSCSSTLMCCATSVLTHLSMCFTSFRGIFSHFFSFSSCIS